MKEQEIENQITLIKTCESGVFFFDMLIHEANVILGKNDLSEKEKEYVTHLREQREVAENAYFESLAELWLLQSKDAEVE